MTNSREFYSQKFAKTSISSDRLKKVLSIFKGHHFNRLLDIGCGDGQFSVLLNNFSNEIYGVDIAEEAVELARRSGIKAYRVDIDKEDLPFEGNYFEAAFCGEVIEHLYDSDHLLSELYRVLAPSGMLVITTPNLAYWLNRIVLLLGFQPYLTEVSLKHNVGKFKADISEVSGHIRSFTYRALKNLLELHNFKVDRAERVDINKVLPFPINLLEKCLSRKASFGHTVIFVTKVKKTETGSGEGIC